MLDEKQLVGDLQEMRDNGYLSDALLRAAVKSIESSDDRYDWVGAFLLRTDEEELWLHNYVGEPAGHAVVAVGEGLTGAAVVEKKNQNVADVTTIDGYESCAPDARSELIVLIRAGDEVFGEIEVDSEEASAFKDEDEAALRSVADKLAEQLMAERR